MDPFTAGATVGQYRIEMALGEGGMGVVYKALDPRLQRAVAIKFLSGDLADTNTRRRFQREAQAASSLNHPHILTVHDVGEIDGRQYLVTELAEGGTLGDWARSGPRPWHEIVELLVGIGDALATAHEAGIVHRDLKPANILLMKRGAAKLADFGLARVEAGADAVTGTMTATAQGVIAGTASYMSPEQATGGAIDLRSDVFSFGVVLYELLAGRRPFSGPTSVDVLHAIVHAAPPPLSKALPSSLRAVVDKLLEKEPADRYQSMREVVVDLRRLLRHSPGVADSPPRSGVRSLSFWIAVTVLGTAAVAATILLRRGTPSAVPRFEYTPLTSFADSAVAPALSPDGRILAFIRGPNTFAGPGEVYAKLLPDGEPVQLTHDHRTKMGPLAFSPDGARVAYTEGTNAGVWTVPVLGGDPTRLLTNAGALSWIAPAGSVRVLFSTVAGDGIHMGVVTTAENRADLRTVYLPADVNGMAHRSVLSPDGRSVALAEMNMAGWQPCRVVPFDGASSGRQVGPIPSQCTDVAWSPDGRWLYLSANTGNGFHIWRERFPGGRPEQVTSGATEEQGIAFAPDGRSFVTSVGDVQSTLSFHHGSTTQQVTAEGFAYLPSFSADGTELYYLQRSKADRQFVSGELWRTNLADGKRERLLPDTLMEHYDVSKDGTRVVFVRLDERGHSSIWEAVLDGSAAPRRLWSSEAVRALFDPDGDIDFVGGEMTNLYLYRLSRDGQVRKLLDSRANFLYDVSPDGRWIAAWVGAAVAFYPVAGGPPRLLCAYCATAGEENRGVTPPLVQWSGDGQFLYLHSTGTRQTYVLPLRGGAMVPQLPERGFSGIADAARALGATAIPDQRAFMSNQPGDYAFPRVATHRNLYRVPVP